MSFFVNTVNSYLNPPIEFSMTKCLIDGLNGTCYSNFQKMNDVYKEAIIRKTFTVAIAAGLMSWVVLGSGSVLQVVAITAALIFAMETCPSGQLNLDLRRLRN